MLLVCLAFCDYILQLKQFVLSLNENAMLLFVMGNYEDEGCFLWMLLTTKTMNSGWTARTTDFLIRVKYFKCDLKDIKVTGIKLTSHLEPPQPPFADES